MEKHNGSQKCKSIVEEMETKLFFIRSCDLKDSHCQSMQPYKNYFESHRDAHIECSNNTSSEHSFISNLAIASVAFVAIYFAAKKLSEGSKRPETAKTV